MKPERLFGFRIGRVPAGIGYCRPWSHCHTRACPSGGGFASVATEVTVVETAHWAVSKSHLSNPQPPSAKTEKGHSFWNVLLFWWKVVDSNHRSHRRQIYSLFPLATRETFHILLLSSNMYQRLNYNTIVLSKCQQKYIRILIKYNRKTWRNSNP